MVLLGSHWGPGSQFSGMPSITTYDDCKIKSSLYLNAANNLSWMCIKFSCNNVQEVIWLFWILSTWVLCLLGSFIQSKRIIDKIYLTYLTEITFHDPRKVFELNLCIFLFFFFLTENVHNFNSK